MCEDKAQEELVSKARSGDRGAFDDLVRESTDDLLAFVASRLGRNLRGQLEPEDIVQEAFLRAFERFNDFKWRGRGSLRRWLFAIAEHLIRNQSRKGIAGRAVRPIEIQGSEPSPSRAVRREERFDKLRDALMSLSPDHRRVIQLARIEGLKIKEIAERMERTPGAVKQLLSRALDRLRHRVGDTESLSLPERSIDLGSQDDA
jgi:RNA polymerase sigma-70 factor (ECF subfamily)